MHPPFRWQREYARGFVAGVRRLTEETGITFAVENMYPWRTPGGELRRTCPGWDPTELDYDDLTLDFSHASTANQQSWTWPGLGRPAATRAPDRRQRLGQGRAHGARTRRPERGEGAGVPGREDFDGHVVLEVNTRKADTRAKREADLAESLAFTRLHLAAPVHPTTRRRCGVATR